MAAAVAWTLMKRDGTLQMDPYEHIYQIKRKLRLYDNSQRRWIKMYIHDIPWTYTFAPRPTNYKMEARLWMFAARRVRHRFIWSREQIPKAVFCKIKSRSNSEYNGRFTFLHF